MDLNERKARAEAMQANGIMQMFNMYDFSWRWTRKDDVLCFGLMIILLGLIVWGLA